jgi:chitin disaccharide deacetylase
MKQDAGDRRRAGRLTTQHSPRDAGPGRPRTLIVTADDFGRDIAVNEAVERGHRDGILTCASLMVAEPAAADAVGRARHLPRLGVGLHLTFVDGKPTLPPERVSALVGSDGRFRADPLRQGLHLFFSWRARRQLAIEMRAQFDAFRATGLTLDHVNAHHHFHVHPVIQRNILHLAAEYGVAAVRIPIVRQRMAGRRRSFVERSNAWQGERLRRRLAAAGILSNDEIFGLAESGHVSPATISGAVAQLGSGIGEVYCHPVARVWRDGDPWPRDYDGMGELGALLDPALRDVIRKSGIRLANFREAAS